MAFTSFSMMIQESVSTYTWIVYHVFSEKQEGEACALWMDAVKGAQIREIHAGGCRFTNETFRLFIEQHPELEYIKVSWTPELTDISPLLTLQNLRSACVSNNMQQAIRSLGDGYGFDLEIE